MYKRRAIIHSNICISSSTPSHDESFTHLMLLMHWGSTQSASINLYTSIGCAKYNMLYTVHTFRCAIAAILPSLHHHSTVISDTTITFCRIVALCYLLLAIFTVVDHILFHHVSTYPVPYVVLL